MPCAPLLSDPAPWLAVFGRAHPVLLHAPLGIVPAIAVLEFGAALLRRENPRGPVLALAWLGAVCAAAAIASGLVLAGEPGYGGDVIGQHKIAGIALGALVVLTALLACLRRRAPMRIALLLACAAMVPAGHLGGTLTHGADFLFEPLRGLPPANATEYERTIQPIWQRSCTKCHNPTKHKGDLDLSTAAGLRKGGESGEVFTAGKPDDSAVLTLCLLPPGDDDVMPPAGKQPRPTKAELDTLRAWLAAGAKFE